MRLVQVVSSLGANVGGPVTVVLALHDEYAKRGVIATLLAADYEGKSLRPLPDDERQSLLRFQGVRLFRRSRPYLLQGSWGLARRIWREVRSTDFVEVHGQYLLPQVYAYAACCWFKKPYSIFPHGTLEPYQRNRRRFRKAIYGVVIGNKIRRAARYVVFASESESQRARHLVEGGQILIAPLGYKIETPCEDTKIAEQLGAIPRSRCVLFLGRLAHKKRPELLVRAWANSSLPASGRLVIAGPDDEVSQADLRELAHSLGVAGSVLFPGRIDGRRKSWLYGRCGTFVLPSENENFGLTVVEAMTHGCAVVASSEVASFDFALRAGVGFSLANLEVATLARALEQAVDTVCEVGDNVAGRARSYAQEHLDWSSATDALMRNYFENSNGGR